MHRMGVVAVGSGELLVLLEHRLELAGGLLAQRITPLAVSAPGGPGWSGPAWERLRAKALALDADPRRARFSRELLLPEALRGLGLGTYILCALVRRAVGRGCGGARVRALHLLARQHSPLRSAFYLGMGFELTLYADGSGWARAPRLDGLRAAHDPAKVREAWPVDLAPGREALYIPLPHPARKGGKPWK
ncbi:hypothetical protein [Desulfocurvus sp. DL9XJH121]